MLRAAVIQPPESAARRARLAAEDARSASRVPVRPPVAEHLPREDARCHLESEPLQPAQGAVPCPPREGLAPSPALPRAAEARRALRDSRRRSVPGAAAQRWAHSRSQAAEAAAREAAALAARLLAGAFADQSSTPCPAASARASARRRWPRTSGSRRPAAAGSRTSNSDRAFRGPRRGGLENVSARAARKRWGGHPLRCPPHEAIQPVLKLRRGRGADGPRSPPTGATRLRRSPT